ncbi:MAG TPA: potassium-transporting ATPase subunit KdpC [Pirellulales bacterium]|jgi:K+-transporting ATPase ATPase C chain|nr:potassium-transporting ATPase subunit KdpC [Pirellulales bacterium]
MLRETLIAVRLTVVTLVLTGLLYPALVTQLAQLLFPSQANGSLVYDQQNHVVGSRLIGQSVIRPDYFQPRPSAAGNGYDPTASSGSNLGPTSQKLHDRVVADIDRLQKENPQATGPIPDELVTASASGLDPEISPEGALWQVPRVAEARQIAPERVRRVVENQVQGRDLGFLGERRVNVLLLNLALDRQFGKPL